MNYSAKEIMQYVSEEDVKFIRLAFCDIFGNQKNISVMPDELIRAFDTGIAFDSLAIKGFGGEVHSDLFLHPDPSTISVLPWRPEHGRVVRMFCDITDFYGRTFSADTRAVLKKAVSEAANAGYLFSFGSEMEFYLFKLDENGEPTNIPYDKAGYMDIAPDDKGENVRREICLTLEKMGIYPESSHHEEGPGQNEIDFKFSDPLTAADNAVTFKSVVRTVAARNGLFADFSAKPLSDFPGNGFHINVSVKSGGKHDLLPYVISGILKNINDMTLFLNPNENSYDRLGKQKAPKYITWSSENRSQLIRIPAAGGDYRRVELRSPDPGANPYLAFALIIYAGLEGLKNEILPPVAADINLFGANISEEITKKYKTLPLTLEQAKKAASESVFLRSCLTEKIIKEYTM